MTSLGRRSFQKSWPQPWKTRSCPGPSSEPAALSVSAHFTHWLPESWAPALNETLGSLDAGSPGCVADPGAGSPGHSPTRAYAHLGRIRTRARVTWSRGAAPAAPGFPSGPRRSGRNPACPAELPAGSPSQVPPRAWKKTAARKTYTLFRGVFPYQGTALDQFPRYSHPELPGSSLSLRLGN